MKHSNSQKKSNTLSLRFTLLILFLACIFCTAFYVLFYSPVFFVKTINVFGTGQYSNKEDIRTIALGATNNIKSFELSKENLKILILKNFKGIKDARVTIEYPHTLNIVIEERKPKFLLSTSDTNYVVDTSGLIFGEVQQKDFELPRIIYNDKVGIGILLEPNTLNTYLELIAQSKDFDIQINDIKLYENYITANLNTGEEIFMSSTQPIAESLAKLKQVYTELKDSKNDTRTIDLRYDKVVVTYR
ncbi:FtsQ-type POTRA domain-containing protein [candidate division WWE3 bacterium]|uniref:FtsQ-type POTRA domain-containing protein n=1 Tax=candidate division WWE3 bacterium TaxID=2053526 RepID=A0A955J1H5_UNCKA|nr:FtsQ-type POTRA domain-containing protein [candidate division WWE3 bacterium]